MSAISAAVKLSYSATKLQQQMEQKEEAKIRVR